MNSAASEINRASEILIVAMERKSSLVASLDELEGLHDQSPISLIVAPGAWENMKQYHEKLWHRDTLKFLIDKAARDYQTGKDHSMTSANINESSSAILPGYPDNCRIYWEEPRGSTYHGYASLLSEYMLVDNEVRECQKSLDPASLVEATAYFEHVKKIKDHIEGEEHMIAQIEMFLKEQKCRYRRAMQNLEEISQSIHHLQNTI